MELIEIKSGHDLTAHPPAPRRPIPHSYLVSCHQFKSIVGSWRRSRPGGPASEGETAIGLMTLAADRIWVTEEELARISAAIDSASSAVSLT